MKKTQEISIMVVDDDNLDIENIHRAFLKNNMINPLCVAYDGVDAWEKLTGENGVEQLSPLPKIMVLDINMPRMNGLELLGKMRANDILKSMMVFILTTSDDDKDIIKPHNLNVAGYLLKPVLFKDFMNNMVAMERYWLLIEYPGSVVQ